MRKRIINFNECRSNLISSDISNEVVIIKSALDKKVCELVKDYIVNKVETEEENHDVESGNWYYTTKRENTEFFQFRLNNLKNTNNDALIDLFNKMFDITNYINKFKCASVFDEKEGLSFKPLIMFYPSGIGKFDWHHHPSPFQEFQVIINITAPSRDYTGAETLIRDRHDESEVSIGSEFEQGDMVVFPIDLWHKVNPVVGNVGRMTAILPFHGNEGGYYST